MSSNSTESAGRRSNRSYPSEAKSEAQLRVSPSIPSSQTIFENKPNGIPLPRPRYPIPLRQYRIHPLIIRQPHTRIQQSIRQRQNVRVGIVPIHRQPVIRREFPVGRKHRVHRDPSRFGCIPRARHIEFDPRQPKRKPFNRRESHIKRLLPINRIRKISRIRNTHEIFVFPRPGTEEAV